MKSTISFFRTFLERQKGKQLAIEQNISALAADIKLIKKDVRRHEQALEIVKEVGLRTQQQLQYHISEITSTALDAVFGNTAYELIVEFIERRNKTECDLFFSRDGIKIDPITASGGGAVDVAAFALRIASWSMARPRSRNVIILDEPLRFLSEDNQERASQMIKELSEKLGLQFIIVTHNETLTAYADRVFEVKIKSGKSKVTQL